MKKAILFAVALVATFAVSMKMHSSTKAVKPSIEYCAFDINKNRCVKTTGGTACYLVDENCNYIDE